VETEARGRLQDEVAGEAIAQAPAYEETHGPVVVLLRGENPADIWLEIYRSDLPPE
jgi:hypothetical protein